MPFPLGSIRTAHAMYGCTEARDGLQLAVLEALFSTKQSVCKCVCVCVSECVSVWSAGTGTADPPLTPGGVYKALEREEEEEAASARAITQKGMYHFLRIRGCTTVVRELN